MKKSVNISFLTLVFLYAFASTINAQLGSNSVSGVIFDPNRTPVGEVQVELLNEFNSILQRVRTDGAGRYVFRRVPAGRLYVRVLPLTTPFEEQTQEIEITNVGALGRRVSDNVQKDFYLRVRKNSNSNEVNSVLFAQEVPNEAKKLFEEGLEDLDKKKIDEGIAKLENSIKIFPTYFRALEKLGLEYIQQQKFKEAKQYLLEAAKTNPRCFNCLYGVSYSSFSMNDFIDSINYGKKALDIDRRSASIHLLLGLAYRSNKDYKNAKESLIEAKKIDKINPDINWNLALLYAHNLKQYDDAASELENYLKNSPDLADKESIKKLIKQFKDKAKESK